MKLYETLSSNTKEQLDGKLRYLGIKNYTINDDLSVTIDGNGSIKLSTLQLLQMPINVKRVFLFTTSDIPVTSFDLFPKIVENVLRILIVKSLKGIHKHVSFIGKQLTVGSTAHLLPTHMLGIGLIKGNFNLSTINSDLDAIFNKHRESGATDILILQDKLIEAGFVNQAKL